MIEVKWAPYPSRRSAALRSGQKRDAKVRAKLPLPPENRRFDPIFFATASFPRALLRPSAPAAPSAPPPTRRPPEPPTLHAFDTIGRERRRYHGCKLGSHGGLATPAGLEPATCRLEGGCSIQLSYGAGFPSASVRPCADAIVPEIVGIGNDLASRGLGSSTR